jgi:tyrosinase
MSFTTSKIFPLIYRSKTNVSRFHYGGRPYKIDVFFGNNRVGYVYNFSTPPDLAGTSPQGCGNCKQQQLDGNLSTGQIPITQAVWDDPAVDEMNTDEVERYLAEHLRWTVTITVLSLSPYF